MISHQYGNKILKHQEFRSDECPVCIPEQAIERIKELIIYMSTCPSGDADDCRLHARWIQEALDGGYE